MKKAEDIFPIDLNITPQNAEKNQYEFVCDVINPYLQLKELLEMVLNRGYIFGSSTNDDIKHFGLYRKKDNNKYK